MRPNKYENEIMKRRDILFPDSIWNDLVELAKEVTIEIGRKIKASDLVRTGCEDIIKKLRKRN